MKGWNRTKTGIFFVALCSLLILSLLLSIRFGNAQLSVADVYGVLVYKLFHWEEFAHLGVGPTHDIVWVIRLPRVLLAMLVGIGLSVCGVIMQAVVKNPLSDPYILGISSGASFGATIAVLSGIGTVLGTGSIGVLAFAGAMGTTLAVIFLSNLGGRANMVKLVLSGMVMSAIFSAFSSFMIYIANDKNATVEITHWLMGSMAGAKWFNVSIVFWIVLLGTLFFATQYKILNTMLLGDDAAITLGVNVYVYRTLYMIVTSLIIGFIVYASGVIGFVGLVVPHFVRLLVGTDHQRVVPFSAVIGGIFLIWADVVSRVLLAHSEIPIGIIISLIGAPCFIYLLIRYAYRFGGGVK